MNSSEKIVIEWADYDINATQILKSLRAESDFHDVSIGCSDSNGKTLEAHKVILACFSSVFRSMFKQNQSIQMANNTALFLRGAKHQHLSSLLDFIYQGEVKIPEAELSTFLSTAEDLKVIGLSNDTLFDERNLSLHQNFESRSEKFLKTNDEFRQALPGTNKRKIKTEYSKGEHDETNEENLQCEAPSLEMKLASHIDDGNIDHQNAVKEIVDKKRGRKDRRSLHISDIKPILSKRANLPNPTITDVNGERLTVEKSEFRGFNLVHDNHTYHIRDCGSKTLGWECKRRKVLNCKATVSTDVEVTKLLRKSHDHTHAPIKNKPILK